LSSIVKADFSGLDPRLFDVPINIACDVKNPLYGINGAAYVFGPQKGANSDMVKRLDAGLRHFAGILEKNTNIKTAAAACKIGEKPLSDGSAAFTDISGRDAAGDATGQKRFASSICDIPGAGAAGGVAVCFLALGIAELVPGIDLVLDTIGFDEQITNADLIITGEGKTDSQTLGGKTVLGVARRAKKYGVPVVVVSGAVEDGVDEKLYAEGVKAVFSCCRETDTFERIRDKCPEWFFRTVVNVMKIYYSRRI
jgi:glycerate kinase